MGRRVEAATAATATMVAPHQVARQARYGRVHELRALGLSQPAVAARVGMTPVTVRNCFRAPTRPTRAVQRTEVGSLTRIDSHFRARWKQGCEDAKQLWREVQVLGFRGSLRTVLRHVARWCTTFRRAEVPRATASTAPRPPSPRQARWWLLLSPERLSENQRRDVGRLTAACAPVRPAERLALAFGHELRGGAVSALTTWLDEAAQSELSLFREFAAGLRRDLAWIEAAVRGPWSNGQTEGQDNKLKMLERQMYGRASVTLLRQRMLGAA